MKLMIKMLMMMNLFKIIQMLIIMKIKNKNKKKLKIVIHLLTTKFLYLRISNI